MISQSSVQEIIIKLAHYYKGVYGNDLSRVYLYGSYARGDYQSDSDIDIVAIVNGDRAELQKKLYQVWDYASDLELEYDVIISPTVIPTAEFIRYQTALPYYANIVKDGIEYTDVVILG